MGDKVVSFHDLDVYRASYALSITVIREVVPTLPHREQPDLGDQLARACKAIPRLIGEGYARRHQRLGFQKYLDDAMGEANEMVVSLSQCRDLYASETDAPLYQRLVDQYDKIGRQLYRLALAWDAIKQRTSNVTQQRNGQRSRTTDNGSARQRAMPADQRVGEGPAPAEPSTSHRRPNG